MKPWLTLLNKAPSQGGKREDKEKERGTKSEPKAHKPKGSHKGAKGQSPPTSPKKHIK